MSIPSTPSERLHTEPPARNGIAAALSSLAGPSLRRLLQRLLQGVACGSLQVELPGGERAEAQGSIPGPQAAITLHRWRPLARLLLRGDMGLAESYRDGDWSSPDLTALLEFGIRNEASWGKALEASWLSGWLSRLVHRLNANSRRGSRQNISFHYDLGNAFYAQWLDAEMVYSSGIYANGDETLAQAQAAKLARILALLDVQPGASVLEIGCGWGALASAIGKQGASVTGLTLSTEQLAHAQQRIAGEGLAGQVELRLQDYRDVQGRYDRIVSIEMLEAVGEAYWPVYFDTLRQRLQPGGKAVLQAITIDDLYFERYRRGTDFIQRFIFPGGMLPSPAAMHDEARKAGLRIVHSETFGAGYAATLADWRHNFLGAWPAIQALGFDASFRRLWEYYLCYCEAGFLTGRVDVGLYTVEHAQAAT